MIWEKPNSNLDRPKLEFGFSHEMFDFWPNPYEDIKPIALYVRYFIGGWREDYTHMQY